MGIAHRSVQAREMPVLRQRAGRGTRVITKGKLQAGKEDLEGRCRIR